MDMNSRQASAIMTNMNETEFVAGKTKGVKRNNNRGETEFEKEQKHLKGGLTKAKAKADKAVEKAADKLILLQSSTHPIAPTLKKTMEEHVEEVKQVIAGLRVSLKEQPYGKKMEKEAKKAETAVGTLIKDVALATSLSG